MTMTDACPTGCTCNWKKKQPNERMLEMVRLLHYSNNYVDQTPGRNGITGLQHALRCGALGTLNSDYSEAGFIGLVHDLARPLNDVHHGEVIAEMVRDRVSETAYQILRTHGTYQAAIVHETDFPVEPWSDYARELADIELMSFAGDYTGPVLTMAEAVALMERFLG